MPSRPKVVAFDIIGTVFSMEPMRPRLVKLGLPPLALEFLYTAGLRDTFALAASNTFAPFQTVLAGCLDELLAMQGVSATEDQKQDVLATMKHLPPHDDARAAFLALTEAGIKIFALSNGAASATKALLQAAELDSLVEEVLSVEDVKLSKPRPEVYLYAVEAAKVRPEEMALIAAHPWDVHGAKIADLTTGYVARGRPFSPALRSPDIKGETLLDVAREMAQL